MNYIVFLLLGLLSAGPAGAAWDYTTVEGVDGVPLSVMTAGRPEQPAIVFIHGIGQSQYSFRKQFESDLVDNFYLVAFDLRGHGASGKPWDEGAYSRSAWAGDVAAVIAATHARKPVIVAWSFGTLVALDYVRQFGTSTLAGLCLTGAIGALRPFTMPTVEEDPKVAEFARFRELQLSPNLADQVAASQQFVPWLTATPVPEAEQRVMQSIGMMLPAYARRAIASQPRDNQDLLEVLTLPIWLPLGAEDNQTMLANAAEIAATHANFSLSVYAGAGHSVFY
jgi:pimeloyl-ACP methyl ester carboxylesterase